jgi:hypothetical protein
MAAPNSDPAWLRLLDRAYALVLYLYPAEHRREYGPWIRQAVRDRAREVVRGEASLAGLLFAELLPDLLGSLWHEHTFSFAGFRRRRVLAWIGALGLTAAAVVHSDLFGDWLYRNYNPRMSTWQESEAEWQREQEVLAGFLVYLEHESTPRAQALRMAIEADFVAPWLRSTLADDLQSVADDINEADRLSRERIDQLLAGPIDPATMAALSVACGREWICDQARLAAVLQRESADNGYTWLWAFHVAERGNDDAGQRVAIHRLARSEYFQAPLYLMMQELIRQRRAYRGEDAELDGVLFSRTHWMPIMPMRGLLERCRRAKRDVDLPLIEDCDNVAKQLKHSATLAGRVNGAILAYQVAANEADRLDGQALYRQVTWLLDQSRMKWQSDRPIFRAHGSQWLAAWETADSELDAITAWVEANHRSPQAPGSYELSPSRQQRLTGVSP